MILTFEDVSVLDTSFLQQRDVSNHTSYMSFHIIPRWIRASDVGVGILLSTTLMKLIMSCHDTKRFVLVLYIVSTDWVPNISWPGEKLCNPK